MYNRFLRCVVGKTLWNDRVMKATGDNDLCSVSDEAFTLLVLENSWDRWADIHKKHQGNLFHRRGVKKREWISDVAPKFTAGGIAYKTNTKKTDLKGWSQAGIQRYNELYRLVCDDRRRNAMFGKEYIDSAKEEKKKKKQKTSESDMDAVLPFDDLFGTLDHDLAVSLSNNFDYATEDVQNKTAI